MGIFGQLKKMKNIRLLPPRDKEFYEIFNEFAATLTKAAEMLLELFEAPALARGEIETRIATCKMRCARVGESLEDLLKRSQQPPFDRPDISQFVVDTNRVIRYISHAANRYVVYDFPSSDKEMRELAPLVLEACQEIESAIRGLAKDRNIDPYHRAVDLLETKADEIYHEGLRRRFQEIRHDRTDLEKQLTETNADITAADLVPIISANVEYTRHVAVFFILRQVYAELERAIDACTDVMTTLKRMVTKNV